MLVEVEGDGPFGRALQVQGEDELYHLGGIGIDHQLVLILRGFYIAVRSKGADVLAVPPLVVEHLPDLFGSLKAVVVVDNICDGHLNVAHTIRALVAVHVIPQADKPHIELHKEVVDQAACVAVIPGEPG